ncbi:phage tail protein, partial [Klebsiella aerogenes]
MAETIKEQLLKQVALLNNDRSSFEPHWRELSDFINPRGSRFLVTDVNRNDRRNTKTVDPTATLANRTLSSGMMSGITSPARPWFKLATPDPDMMDYGPVKLWLEAVQRRMNEVYNKSNLYQSLPLLYSSLGTYSTGAMAVLEDDEDVIRTMMFPIGSYYLANSARGSVDTCYRKFTMTVRQLVMEFGMSNVSASVKGLWESGSYETWIEVIHAVYPNIDRDTGKLDSKNKRVKSVYFEVGGDNDKLLRESGFDEFPIMA